MLNALVFCSCAVIGQLAEGGAAGDGDRRVGDDR